MPRNIVICMDGTGNEIEENISNVLKIYRASRKYKDQLVFYTQGVGTLVEPRPWRRASQFVKDQLLGGAFGFGLEDRVQQAYRFLVDNYEADDRIFIFGYSRGAYAARVLAGMIHAVGILHRHQANLVGSAYRAYMAEPRKHEPVTQPVRAQALSRRDLVVQASTDTHKDRPAQSFKRITQSHEPLITFLGLFDTVNSVVGPSYFRGTILPLTRTAHPYTYYNPSVKTVRHALSLDEKRHMFSPERWPAGQEAFRTPWSRPSAQDLQEVWFPGWHGDVGGGNPRDESGLSQFPLIWMFDAAMTAGLHTNKRTRLYVTGVKPYTSETVHKYPRADAAAKIHPSINFTPKGLFWGLQQFDLYRANRTRPKIWKEPWVHWPIAKTGRTVEPTDAVHSSVCRRLDAVPKYRPPNLPEGICETGMIVDLPDWATPQEEPV